MIFSRLNYICLMDLHSSGAVTFPKNLFCGGTSETDPHFYQHLQWTNNENNNNSFLDNLRTTSNESSSELFQKDGGLQEDCGKKLDVNDDEFVDFIEEDNSDHLQEDAETSREDNAEHVTCTCDNIQFSSSPANAKTSPLPTITSSTLRNENLLNVLESNKTFPCRMKFCFLSKVNGGIPNCLKIGSLTNSTPGWPSISQKFDFQTFILNNQFAVLLKLFEYVYSNR